MKRKSNWSINMMINHTKDEMLLVGKSMLSTLLSPRNQAERQQIGMIRWPLTKRSEKLLRNDKTVVYKNATKSECAPDSSCTEKNGDHIVIIPNDLYVEISKLPKIFSISNFSRMHYGKFERRLNPINVHGI